ncbi:putative signal peptide-containing protein [Cryptosporidium canis]|uniref:Signal peptide-containing protein n=1 Tax=Cryptosporidium canis TaxID=195482 RepID=A0A9D5HYT6_9CRYT|nr:putative signal peptide-containing protein [Cryptosporidium canis]
MRFGLILVLMSVFLALDIIYLSPVLNPQIQRVESIRDMILNDVLTQMNLTNETVLKDEKTKLYMIYINETSADEHDKCMDEISTLKFVNQTHICYVLGDKNSKILEEISNIIHAGKNSTEKINLDDLYNVKNISEILDKVDSEVNVSNTSTALEEKPSFRSLASFHDLTSNEINYRRNYLKRRYFDEVDESKLSEKEKKKRKKRRKKLKKREKELRNKRKKYKSPLDKLRSTIKWMACIEISMAVCSCCLNVVQAFVIPFISPIPLGARIQPVAGMGARGFEDYGFYPNSGIQGNCAYNTMQFNMGNTNANNIGLNGNCNSRFGGGIGGGIGSGIGSSIGNALRGGGGNLIGNNFVR